MTMLTKAPTLDMVVLVDKVCKNWISC